MFGTYENTYCLCVRWKERVPSSYDVISMYTCVNDKCNLYVVSIFNSLWGSRAVCCAELHFEESPTKKFLRGGAVEGS
jgi:hypothetical protein